MLNFWKKKKINSELVSTELTKKNVPVRIINYHPKVILAWAKALEGNEQIALWLKENGLEELVFANAAIYLKDEARKWLMENGYPHLMAMIHAAEGDEKAQKWLLHNNFEILYHIALAVDDDQESWKWLNLNATQDLFLLAKSIKKIKDQIEENHNDVHSFRKD
jgi:hypothetical protein